MNALRAAISEEILKDADESEWVERLIDRVAARFEQIDERWYCGDGCGSGAAHGEDCRPEAIYVLRSSVIVGPSKEETRCDGT